MLIRALLCGLCAALIWLPALAADIPAVTDEALEQALAVSDQNRPELEAALDACRGDAFKLAFKRFRRVEGVFRVDPGVAVRGVQVRIFEAGAREPRATQTFRLDH